MSSLINKKTAVRFTQILKKIIKIYIQNYYKTAVRFNQKMNKIKISSNQKKGKMATLSIKKSYKVTIIFK